MRRTGREDELRYSKSGQAEGDERGYGTNATAQGHVPMPTVGTNCFSRTIPSHPRGILFPSETHRVENSLLLFSTIYNVLPMTGSKCSAVTGARNRQADTVCVLNRQTQIHRGCNIYGAYTVNVLVILVSLSDYWALMGLSGGKIQHTGLHCAH